ncbi:MAG: hypothetical protein GXP14_04120 [Gammaproteobacteria bacterium]|nr:hypothetical protein [Gammaproteobacteria bacterium]
MSHSIKLSVKQQIQLFKNTLLQLPALPFSDILSTGTLEAMSAIAIGKQKRKSNLVQ